MNPMPRSSSFEAPWGRALRVTSIVVPAFCAAVVALGFPTISPHRTLVPAYWLWTLLPAMIFVAALFTIRGYRIEGSTVCIERLLWDTRLPLEGLLSASVERQAMRGSIRTCGNGGLFSFTGWWWSRRLGRFRAFVTDLRLNVVLRFADRTVVLSPAEPEEFVQTVLRAAGIAS